MREQLDQRGGSRYAASGSLTPDDVVNQIQAQYRQELESILNERHDIIEVLRSQLSDQSRGSGGLGDLISGLFAGK